MAPPGKTLWRKKNLKDSPILAHNFPDFFSKSQGCRQPSEVTNGRPPSHPRLSYYVCLKKKKKNQLPVFKNQSFALKSEFLASLEKKIRQSHNAEALFLGGSRWPGLNGWDASFSVSPRALAEGLSSFIIGLTRSFFCFCLAELKGKGCFPSLL